MARVLAALLLAISAAAGQVSAQVAEPIYEAQAYLRTRELFSAVNSAVRPQYAGTLANVCGGATINIQITNLAVTPTTWAIEADGRNGIALSASVDANLAVQGTSWGCGYQGPVHCQTAFKMTGALRDTNVPPGNCYAPSLKLLSVAFDLFHAPDLFSRGAKVDLPPCETKNDDFTCLRWVRRNGSSFEPDPSQDRYVHAAARLFGFADALPVPSNPSDQALDNLTADAHVGERADISLPPEPYASAMTHVTLHPSDSRSGFALKLNLDALEDVHDELGTVIDHGALTQIFPIQVYGAQKLFLLGKISYQFVFDTVTVERGRSRGKPVRIIELSASTPEIRKTGGKRTYRPFRELRARAVIEKIIANPDGTISLRVEDAHVTVGRLLGIFRLSFGGSVLAHELDALLNHAKVTQINKDIDVAIPKCIVVEGNPTPDAIDKCQDPGMLKHIGGVRGIRASIKQDSITVIDDVDSLYLSGAITLTQLDVGQ